MVVERHRQNMTAKIVVAAVLVENERFRLPVGLTGAGSTIRIKGCDGSARPDGSLWPLSTFVATQHFGSYRSNRWGNRPTSLWIAEDFWVLRFRLMVKRGPR